MHYVLGAGWPGPSACRPAPTRHIIASSALEQLCAQAHNDSHLALPGLHPFPGIDLAGPFLSHILIHPGQRQWQPRSERILGCPPSPSHLHAAGSDGLAI